MTEHEYISLQQQLSRLIEKAELKYSRGKERDAYVDGIYACKSALHNEYNMKNNQSGGEC